MTKLADKVRAIRALPAPPLRRAIRMAAGVSQRDIAAEVGRSRPTVSRWEAGERMPQGEDLDRYIAILRSLQDGI
ncbi:MAG: helix-turn-helix domain-containing protein [Acidimicrobiales bacterium]